MVSCRVFRACYRRQAEGLDDGLAYFGLEFEGRQHSGVDDAINTAILLMTMLAQGCRMRLTSSNIRPELTAKRVAGNQPAVTVGTQPDGKRNSGQPSSSKAVYGGTAPFCACMRRSVAHLCTTPGLNLGSTYFSCCQGKAGCGFFLWVGQ